MQSSKKILTGAALIAGTLSLHQLQASAAVTSTPVANENSQVKTQQSLTEQVEKAPAVQEAQQHATNMQANVTTAENNHQEKVTAHHTAEQSATDAKTAAEHANELLNALVKPDGPQTEAAAQQKVDEAKKALEQKQGAQTAAQKQVEAAQKDAETHSTQTTVDQQVTAGQASVANQEVMQQHAQEKLNQAQSQQQQTSAALETAKQTTQLAQTDVKNAVQAQTDHDLTYKQAEQNYQDQQKRVQDAANVWLQSQDNIVKRGQDRDAQRKQLQEKQNAQAALDQVFTTAQQNPAYVTAQKKLSQQKAAVDGLTAEIAKLTKDREVIKDKIKKMHRGLKKEELKLQVKGLKIQIDARNRKLRTATNHKNTTQATFDKLNKLIMDAESAATANREAQIELLEKVASIDGEIEKLKQIENEKHDAFDQAQRFLEPLKAALQHVVDLQATIDHAKETLAQAQAVEQTRQTAADQAQSELTTAKGNLKAINEQLNIDRQNLSTLVATQTEEIGSAHQPLAEALLKLDQAKDAVAVAQQQLTTAKATLTTVQHAAALQQTVMFAEAKTAEAKTAEKEKATAYSALVEAQAAADDAQDKLAEARAFAVLTLGIANNETPKPDEKPAPAPDKGTEQGQTTPEKPAQPGETTSTDKPTEPGSSMENPDETEKPTDKPAEPSKPVKPSKPTKPGKPGHHKPGFHFPEIHFPGIHRPGHHGKVNQQAPVNETLDDQQVSGDVPAAQANVASTDHMGVKPATALATTMTANKPLSSHVEASTSAAAPQAKAAKLPQTGEHQNGLLALSGILLMSLVGLLGFKRTTNKLDL